MEEACCDAPPHFRSLAHSQDIIGWRRMMEGMISKEMITIQLRYASLAGSAYGIQKWASGPITKLLEITHGQWLYRNCVVHDRVTGVLAKMRKEELIIEIEKQRKLGDEGLLEEDQFLATINLDDMENTSGERLEYWLLAIRTARRAFLLRQQRQTNSESTTT